jgi:phage tail sheath gpL-like
MWRYSTNLVNELGGHKSLKEAMLDCELRIYSGGQPADADSAFTGTLLYRLSLAGAAFTGVASTAQIDKIVAGSSSEGHTFAVSVGGVTYTYTALAGSSTTIVATGLAALINASPVVSAVSSGADIIVRARFAGNAFTLAEEADTGTLALSTLVANARGNGLQLGSVSAGVISKESGAWQSLAALADGTAGYFVFCQYGDAGAAVTTYNRIMGSCSTTSGDMRLRTLAIETGDPITIDTCTITLPMVRT